MTVTTGCGGWVVNHGGRKTEDRGRSGRRPAAFCLPFSVLCLLVFLGGCDGKAVEQAQQEAREAKATVQQLKHNLALAQKEISDTKAELDAIRQSRDEFQGKIDQAIAERDEAVGVAQKAQETMTAQSSGQVSATATLQKQVNELNALVAEQQKLIEQLQKAAAIEPVPVDQPPAEPNGL